MYYQQFVPTKVRKIKANPEKARRLSSDSKPNAGPRIKRVCRSFEQVIIFIILNHIIVLLFTTD